MLKAWGACLLMPILLIGTYVHGGIPSRMARIGKSSKDRTAPLKTIHSWRGPFCASSCTKESGPTSRPSLSYTVRLLMSICKVVHCRWHCRITNFDSCHTFRTVNSDCILCGGNSYCYGPLSIELHYHLEAKSPKIMTR